MPTDPVNAGVTFDAKTARSVERGYMTPEIAHQRARTLAALDLQTGDHVLDVGCGPGLLVREMAEVIGLSGQATGIDTSTAMLDLARERCGDLPQVTLRDDDLRALPTEANHFDAIACTQVLLFIEDLAVALNELARVLKPGGRIAVLETDWRGCILNTDNNALTRRMFDTWDDVAVSPNLPVRLHPLLRDAGFSDIEVEGIPIINTTYEKGNFSSGFVRGLARKCKDRGVISDTEAKTWLADFEQKDRDDAYFFCVNRYLFTAVKA